MKKPSNSNRKKFNLKVAKLVLTENTKIGSVVITRG